MNEHTIVFKVQEFYFLINMNGHRLWDVFLINMFCFALAYALPEPCTDTVTCDRDEDSACE